MRIDELTQTLRGAGCVFAEEEAKLLLAEAGPADRLEELLRRRVSGEPLEHVLGWAEFCGSRIAVGPGVFVPRRRTEFLAQQAISLAKPGAVVVDLCCGSGALGAAVQRAVPGIELHAADIDPVACSYARRNVRGEVYQGDLYHALPERLVARVDLLLANAPYVPTGRVGLMPPEARLYESMAALDGGADGLRVLRRVAVEAPKWLAPNGHLLFESSKDQAPQMVSAVTGHGWRAHAVTCDDRDATVVCARG